MGNEFLMAGYFSGWAVCVRTIRTAGGSIEDGIRMGRVKWLGIFFTEGYF